MAPAKVKTPTLEQVSAGGVAFRRAGLNVEIAIILTDREKRWQLPKGLVDPGETAEQAAVREVREEAGIETDLVAPIDTIEYWFYSNWDNTKRRTHKSVHFFLLEYRSGNVEDHDHEVAEARWVEIGEAVETLAFNSEKDVVEKARNLIGDAD